MALPVALFPLVSLVSPECCGLGEVFRQCYLNLIVFDPYGTAGDGDCRILRSFAGLYVESPSMPRTFDDVAFQMPFSERSSRMWTGVVDSVEGSVDIKQGNPDSLDLDGLPASRRNVFYFGDGNKFTHGATSSLGRLTDGTGTESVVISSLISGEAYGIELGTYSNTTPRPSHTRSLGWNEVTAWK